MKQEFGLHVNREECTKVERVLPSWLSNPFIISKDLKDDLNLPNEACPNLHPNLQKILKANKIYHFFPVQKAVISQLLMELHGMESRFRPRDICVATPTGSGKTLAFVLPVVQAIQKRTVPAIRALVILPVIELAKQVFEVFQTYASAFYLNVGKTFGLENFITEQRELVEKVNGHYFSKVDILIATPGKLTEHIIKTPGLDFSQLRFLVMDEADKLLSGDGGSFIGRLQKYIAQFKPRQFNIGGLPPYFPLDKLEEPDFFTCSTSKNQYKSHEKEEKKSTCEFFAQPFKRKVINLEGYEDNDEYFPVPCPPYQKLMFSATLSHDPEQLQNVLLYRPILFISDSGNKREKGKKIVLGNVRRPSELTEELVKVHLTLKPLALHYILCKESKIHENFKAIVFASSIELVTKLSVLLRSLSKGKYRVAVFSAMSKDSRKIKLSDFSDGKINILISTDAMARGIDVPGINCVISYEVPSYNTYIHRIGRTARAGNLGKAISLVNKSELKHLENIMGKDFNTISERIVKEEKLEKFESSFKEALSALSMTSKMRNKRGIKIINKTMKRKKVPGNKFN